MRKLWILFFVLALAFTSCGTSSTEDTLPYGTLVSPQAETTPAETTTVLPDVEPTLTVTEELDQEKKAVKITLTGDGTYYFPAYSGVYVEDFQYELIINSQGKSQAVPKPMESPVVLYCRLSAYLPMQQNGETLSICKVSSTGKEYRVEYAPSLNVASFYSAETLVLQDEFLHKAMTAYFGGAYSEIDLLSIGELSVYYNNHDLSTGKKLPHSILIQKNRSDALTIYSYTDLMGGTLDEMPTCISPLLVDDLSHFPASYYLILAEDFDKTAPDAFQERRALYKKLSEEAAMGYQPTENTWSNVQ